MTGELYAVRQLMAPVPLEALMFVLQGGGAADYLLGCIYTIHWGLQNFAS